jgi:hypothetical protein
MDGFEHPITLRDDSSDDHSTRDGKLPQVRPTSHAKVEEVPSVDYDSDHEDQTANDEPYEDTSEKLVAVRNHHESRIIADLTQPSSDSSGEIVFKGRRPHITVEQAFGGLLIDKSEGSLEKDDVERKYNSTIDVKPLIGEWWRPSPASESEAEREDPFPGLDMNEGWNRAIHRGKRDYEDCPAHISHIEIAKAFAGFSLAAQRKLLVVRLSPANRKDSAQSGDDAEAPKAKRTAYREREELQSLFNYVFDACGLVGRPFHTCRSKVLATPITYSTSKVPLTEQGSWASYSETCLRRSDWHKGDSCFSPQSREQNLKRKSEGGIPLYVHRRAKRQCTRKGNQRGYRIVLDNGWRMRMRERAKKGGRWTDGTPRQSLLWLDYFWVLSGHVKEDPLNQMRAYEDAPKDEWKERDYSRIGRSSECIF